MPKDEKSIGGFFVMGSYIVNSWLELGTYYSELYSDLDDKDGKDRVKLPDTDANKLDYEHEGYFKDICLTVRLNLNSNTCVKLEEHILKGNVWGTADNPDSSLEKEDWSMFLLKVSYCF